MFHQYNEFNHWDELHKCNGDLDGDEFTKVTYFYQGEGFQGVYEFSWSDALNLCNDFIMSMNWYKINQGVNEFHFIDEFCMHDKLHQDHETHHQCHFDSVFCILVCFHYEIKFNCCDFL